MRNQYGLPRDIPEGVKREVRQRCGYGCVVCGTAIVEYEHVSPEFAKARSHDAAGIALLCPTCHSKKTRNFLSARRVLEAMKEPAAKRSGFAFSELESSTSHPYVVFAGVTLKNCATPVEIKGLPVLRIEDSEAKGTPYLLSASFFDERGGPSLFIRQNEWQVFADSWDVEATGGRVLVRTGPGEIALSLSFSPGEGVIVERIRMFCGGYFLDGGRNSLDIFTSSGGRLSFTGGVMDNCRVGLSLA
ncbi:HNH endonuclease [Rhizobacter sp. AJA081-3]|uniref:HNH endonuclease n=1 Tax=Rhizobacter sp. AJA081-3 TaxID=2753607 RepID=UPI001ADF163E|nr:HNH endonuclease signature motif containing protein [Rhizobacter sp. AJA081-3]QTN21488.1 HNH endonuclease [Rhizobacter sp. AJA081-3]